MYDNAVAWMIGLGDDRAIDHDIEGRRHRAADGRGRRSRVAALRGRVAGIVRPQQAETTAACCAA